MNDFKAECLTLEMRQEVALLWLDVPGRSHNVIGSQVMAELDRALDRVQAQAGVQLLAIVSRKPAGFAAGADLHEFAAVKHPEQARALSIAGQQLFGKLAALPLPTAAVIHGPCLGGALELALACDRRVVLNLPKTQLALPEIKLGLIPGWGGTQRLPRLIGLERALRVILQSSLLGPAEALRLGLADHVVATPEEALSWLQHTIPTDWLDWRRFREGLPLRTWRQRLLESDPLGRWLIFRGAERVLRRRVPEDMPAPFEALKAIRTGVTQGMAAGLACEHDAIARLATTPASRNLVTLFFLIENARHAGEGAKAETGVAEPRTGSSMRRVGVVGAGTMGAGIAQLAAVKGFEVVVQEINDAALDAGMHRIEDLFRKAVERRLLPEEKARQKLAGIRRTTTWEGFADVDLAIEAVIEELEKKREVFRELDRRTRPEAILATNTSALSVRQLQEGLSHPGRVGGLHFFNPVHKMPLVEVVRTPGTEDGVVTALTQWTSAVGKVPVVVGDSPGFVVNRILMPYLNEAGMLVAEGMPVPQIDAVMRQFGMPVGPLELLDQVGLDIAAHVARSMEAMFAGRLTPHPALELMFRQGWLGQKSGMGFYRYQGKAKQVNPHLASVLPQEKRTWMSEGAGHDLNKEAQKRMVLLMVNEAALCLTEKLAATADVIDVAMVLGTGWAPHRGGPLRYVDDRGAPAIVHSLQDLAARIGPRFEPCAELRRRAASGETFYGELKPARRE